MTADVTSGSVARADRSSGTRAQGTGPVRQALFPVVYLARYGLVGWTALLVVVAEIAIMRQRGAQWRGDLLWTIDWQAVSFVVIGPVVAGAAAMDTARAARGARHLFGNPVLRSPAFAVTLAYTLVVGAVHCAVLLGALALDLPPVGDAFAPLAVLCQVLIVAFFAALGTLAGRFVGPVLAGLVAALGVFGLIYLVSAPTRHVSILDLGGLPTIPRVGYAYSPVFLGLQAALLLAGTAALLVLRPRENGGRRAVDRRDGLLALGLALAVVAASATVRVDRLDPVTAAPTLCGAAGTVETCFYPQHERVADAFTQQFWALAIAAEEKGYAALLPRRVLEATRTQLPQESDPTVGSFFVMPEHLQGQVPALWDVALGVVQPVHCPQTGGDNPPSDRYWADLQALTGTWVALVDPAEAGSRGFNGPPLPPARAAELIEEFRTCNYPHF